MEYYELHPVTPQLRYINKAVEVLKNGGVIIYPTDTVYGLGCDIFNRDAVERIYMIKNEAGTKLFSFLCPDLKDISKYAKVSDFAYKTMKKLMPGPFTCVLPASREVPKKLWTKRKSVGIRVPDNEIARTLAKELGNPIISTSVTTRKGELLYNPEEIRYILNTQVDLMLSVGVLSSETSTIVDLTGDEAEIIREGKGDINLLV
ncbi:MAG: threonylcarbamoyl-AMP synthase [Melioribacteraceae bacterium]|nr:MAG: threonylcarbamoyl-AMP synthase [Melioribacteraceae bacterium]